MLLSDIDVLLRLLSKAREEGKRTGIININTLASQTDFVDSLRALWAQIPPKTRQRISQQSPQQSPQQSTTEHHNRKGSSPPKLTISDDVRSYISRWSENHLSFFHDNGNALGLGDSPIPQLYNYLTEVESRRTVDTIRTRLVKIAFHRLKETLGVHYMRKNHVDLMTKIISSSGIVTHSLDTIQKKIHQWIDLGARTDALCRSIGSPDQAANSHLGNLFCLPDDWKDESIRVLQYTGPERDSKIQSIRDRGILDVDNKAELDRLAANIFDALWTDVRRSIDYHIQSSEMNNDQRTRYQQFFRVVQPSQEVPSLTGSATTSGHSRGTQDNSDDGWARNVNFNFAMYSNNHNNSQITSPLQSVEQPGQPEQPLIWPGNIFDIHNNSHFAPSLDSLGQPEQPGQQLDWPGSIFDIHNNSQVTPSLDLLEQPEQPGQPLIWPGSIFNIHNNSQIIPSSNSFDQAGQRSLWLENAINMQGNNQIMSPVDSFEQSGQPGQPIPGTFDIHNKSQTTPPAHSFDRNAQQRIWTGNMLMHGNSQMIDRSQILFQPPNTAIPLSQQQRDPSLSHILVA